MGTPFQFKQAQSIGSILLTMRFLACDQPIQAQEWDFDPLITASRAESTASA